MAEAPVDVAPEHLAAVREILARHVRERDVWVFGSRVTGKAWEFSDLDLAVIGDQPLSLAIRGELAEDFSESDLPFRVDVVDWATASPSFRSLIEARKIVIQRGACEA
jgi:type I restriction enzyme S subunit